MTSFFDVANTQDVPDAVIQKGLAYLANKYKKPFITMLILAFCGFVVVFIILGFIVGGFAASFDTNTGFSSGTPTTLASTEIGAYLQIFEQAQSKYGVSWAVLAAICKTESSFGANMGPSGKGAVGFMQIMPTTWSGSRNPAASNDADNPRWDTDPESIAGYGGYGTDGDGDGVADPYNPWDAVFAAAKLLSANGFQSNPKKAVYAYNHSWSYVNKVLAQSELYSQQMLPTQNGIWPLPASCTTITCPYGAPRKNSGYHHGVDIACKTGTGVFAAIPGQVSFAGWKGVYGYCVMVKNGSGIETLYGHLSKILVKKGQTVKQNEMLALSGSTGNSTGPHLHFEVRVNGRTCDPLQWLNPPSKNY